ncbi:Smad nuclear-interacting protein [Thalictrum thalictroides]|uniref:Smad nuclear-interacting protein n=1 Tax=Thalictrum thalictroides TaxID=46969 RepID=A0A7J6XBH8_THATH|nr:Smad nuclear-interacting protein [Thalictrum thalictroides]
MTAYTYTGRAVIFLAERKVADIPTDHPSCSKQHTVIQFRQIELMREDTDGIFLNKVTKVRSYLMDLGSTNGTFLNGNRIDAERYYELFEKDTIKFGNSSREFVILHEKSA